MQAVLRLLDALHRPKDLAYGNAWRKRGELLSIFANIARKVDRLEVAMAEEAPSKVESLGDTAADLAIYVGKYLTWLAELHPAEFTSIPPSPPAGPCSADRGPDSLRVVLDNVWVRELATSTAPPVTQKEAYDRILRSFRALETGLIAQADNRAEDCLLASTKTALAWDLLASATWFLVRLGEEDHRHLDRLRTAAVSRRSRP